MCLDVEALGGRAAFDRLIDEILSAGELALRIQRRATKGAQRKPDRSPVTEADQAVETQLRDFLEAHYPDCSFIGEETGTNTIVSERCWLLDPIDGTRAFIRHLDAWSILLALQVDTEPTVGIAYLPAREELFVAATGHGAYLNGRPIRLSKVNSLDDALVAHGAVAQFTDHDADGVLSALGRRTYTQRGFSDFDNYAQLLKGSADAALEMAIHPYDIAPAAVLVREAGGRFTDFSGNPTIHHHTALASNGAIHDAMLELIAGAGGRNV